MANDPVIAALYGVLAADPANHALRCHLATLLLAGGHHAEARAEALIVAGAQPTNVAALTIVADAARALGDVAQADAYAALARAYGQTPSTPPAYGQAPTTPPAYGQPPTNPSGPPAHEQRPAPERELADGVQRFPDTADELMASWADSPAMAEPDVGTLSAVDITLADVGGLEDVKRRLQASFLTPMRNPEVTAQFGKSLRGGLMLWGPPGCGKTYIARALAGELGARFYEIGLSDVLDMYIGQSERNLAGIFEVARRNRPCVLFFDELDALGQKRSLLRHAGAMRGVVNMMLAELDGATSDNEGLFVLAATNHPWDVDSALLRPGRFDRTVLVLPPDAPARAAILRGQLKGRPAAPIDFDRLAKATVGYSGADLSLVVDQATESAMEATMASGVVRPITQGQLQDAVKSVRPSTKEWLETAKNYAIFSNESGTYDDLLAYLKGRRS